MVVFGPGMPPERRGSWAIDVCIALGAAHAALFAVVAIARLTYPFDLEWMEGGELMAAVRILEGKSLYASPSVDFTAFFYTPLYPAVVACLAHFSGGVTYALGRGVSLASTLAAMSLLGLVVRREAGVRYALLAVGTYAALDRFTGTFSDLARPDALALTLAFGSAALARYGARDRSAVFAAILVVLATFAKQTMGVLALGIALFLLIRDRRRGVIFCGVAAVLGGLAALVLERATDGWFAFYVLSGHGSHKFYGDNLFFYFWRDVLILAPLVLLLPLAWGRAAFPGSVVVWLLGLHLAAAFAQRALTLNYPPHMYFRDLAYESPRVLVLVPPLLIAGLLFLRPIDRSPATFRPDPFWLCMFAASLLQSAIGHSTQWAYKNAFLPAALFGALFLALAARDLVERGGTYVVAAAFALQLISLADAPSSRLPDAVDRSLARAFRDRLARIQGPVLVLAHPFEAYEHDGRTYFHQQALADVARLGGVEDFRVRASQHAWSAVVTDEGDGLPTPDAIREFYKPVETLDGPWMKTGVRVHPATLWTAR